MQGTTLVSRAGATVKLRGADRSGTEYMCVQGSGGMFDGPNDAASVAAMAAWRINVVRVPMNEDCWLGINGEPNGGLTAAAYQQALVSYVNLLNSYGMYVILELHWTAPGAFQATWQEGMPDADHSPTFWSQVATTFKGDPAVMFDLFNEPDGTDWGTWLNGGTYYGDQGSTNGRGLWPAAGMQQLINSVRGTGASNVIMAGGLSFANDLSQWLTYKPSDPLGQLAASAHVYNFNTCNTVSCWSSTIAPVAQSVPVVSGEIGEDDGTANFINTYMGWAEANNIGYLAWTWDTWGCGNGPVLIADYSGTPCQTFGSGYQAHLAGHGG